MILKFLGTGPAFSTKNYQTNIIIQIGEKRLLIDAGGDLKFSLKAAGLSYLDLDAFYITHLHGDHIHGVEFLGFCSYFDPKYPELHNGSKMTFFGEKGLLKDAWRKTLRGGLESVQEKVLKMRDLFDVRPIRVNEAFTWEGATFQIVQSVHIMNGYSIVPTFGLIVTDPDSGKKIYFTGDTQFSPHQIKDFYNNCDIIIQDCETSPYKSAVHAHYDDLRSLPKEIKAKMHLVHFSDNAMDDQGFVLPEWCDRAANDGFQGFVEKGTLKFIV